MIWLLDTNAWITYLKRKNDKLVGRVESGDPADMCLCSVVRFELLYGAYKGTQRHANLLLLAKLFGRFPSLPFSDVVADTAGEIRADLEKKGTPIGPFDLLIAATARCHDLIVVSANNHEFSRVPNLKLENWEIE